MNHTRLLAIVPLALAAGLLAGCSAPADGDNGAGNDAAAVAFTACLNDAGQTAKIIDGGQVGLLLPEAGGEPWTGEAPGDDGGIQSAVAVFMDEDGAWMAAGSADAYPADGGMREAWADCEAEVPDFEQPEPDMSGAEVSTISREDMIEQSLAFAECARGEGYADFSDPDDNGMLDFPSGMTEDSFRALLEACISDAEGFGIPISPESAESFDFDWMSVMQEFVGEGSLSGVAVPAAPVD